MFKNEVHQACPSEHLVSEMCFCRANVAVLGFKQQLPLYSSFFWWWIEILSERDSQL